MCYYNINVKDMGDNELYKALKAARLKAANNDLLRDHQACVDQSRQNAFAILDDVFNKTSPPNFLITKYPNGTVRYYYNSRSDYTEAMMDIERSGLIVLDEDDLHKWIEAIEPNVLADNINNTFINMPNLIKKATTLNEEMALEKIKKRYKKWASEK